MKIKKPSLLVNMVVLLVISYLLLAYAIRPSLPSSIIVLYMLFLLVGIFLHVTMDEKRLQEFIKSLADFLAGEGHPVKRALWIGVLVLIPLSLGWAVYQKTSPAATPPAALRTVHPTPPQWIVGMENPLRREVQKDEMKLLEYVEEGRKLYDDYCSGCHGGNLDGKGPHARGFDPKPIDFTDVGTIAQLPESYVFWRIKEGGPGLPLESHPWSSAMPVWKKELKDEQVWRIILYLYEFTGYKPRKWED